MNEWLDNFKQSKSNIRQLLQERIEKANPRCELTTGEAKRLAKLDGMSVKLKLRKNVQNRQLKTWLSEEERTYQRSERSEASLQGVWLYCWHVERFVS